MLEVRLLGQYDVRCDGEPVEISSRPSRLLFAYLSLTPGKRHPRERLAGLLWPESDEASARGNLRQALWRLRKALGDDYLLVDNKTAALNPDAHYWLDTALLDDRSDRDLSAAVAAYQGELLPGYYEEWVLLERERLQAAFERKMHCLLNALESQGEWTAMLGWAEQWISFGQTPEPAYRALMIAHAALGDLAAAAVAYERCQTALQLEISVEPSAETQALYGRLLAGKLEPSRAPYAGQIEGQERAPRHNLPHQPTPFIGRGRELAQVRELLTSTRLLTLVGPGGTGKTRLAQQAAVGMLDAFKNGVYFVSLASIESADLIVQAIAETIGFPLSSDENPRRQLLRHLRYRHYLLILDNFEHLLSAAPLVSRILHAAAGVKIIATSREKLNLQEETILRIEGLAYPANFPTLDALEYSAVQLFIESTRHSLPDFPVGASQMPHIIHICRQLEGMPLAILLAAAWAELLTPAEIASEIERSLDFLHAEWRDVPERHLSVRAVFDPSWQRLTKAQRQLFASLAIFRGGFTREAAETVAGASLHDLASFVNKSLLRRDLRTGRYEMHELLRQYAGEQRLAMPGIGEVVARAHAVYFSDLIQQLWLKLISSEQQAALAAVDADLENLRQSWRFWLQQGDAGHARAYFDSFRRVYDLRGWYMPGSELFAEAAAVFRPALWTADEEAQTACAEFLAGQAYFLANLGYADTGLQKAQESVAILQRLGRLREMVVPYDILQYNAYYIEDREQVTHLDLHQEIYFAADAAGQWKKAYHIAWQGRAAAWRGEYEKARQTVLESLRIFEELGDSLASVWPRFELGNIALLQGDLREAQKQYSAILDTAQAGDFSWPMVKATRYLGSLAVITGDYRLARDFVLSSLQLAEELGMIRDLVSALYDIATVEAAAGDKETAVRLLTLVQEHPLSHHTRTFSLFCGDPEVRFQNLAALHLARLYEEMAPDVYAAARADGLVLDLETAVLALLAGPDPSGS